MLSQPTLYMTFIPGMGLDVSWEPSQIEVDIEDGDLQYAWETMRNVMNYVPGSVRMLILERPRVNVEYIGGIHYFPPEADPSHDSGD
jgi:hypothetical protein